jgi:hypothetical protein
MLRTDMAEEKQKYTISDEERERRRERAKALAARRDPVTGKRLFGGDQGGRRPKKKRATEIINEEIEKHAQEVWQALYRALNSKKEMVSLQAARQMVEIANKETDVTIKEDKSLETTSTEELIELVSSRFARLAESGNLPFEFELGEGEVEEVAGSPELEAGDAEAEQGGEAEPEGSSGSSDTDAGPRTSPFGRRSPNR